MSLREDERRLLREAARRPEDGALRRVLADRLLEAGEPLGELLQLEAEDRDLRRRRALELELRRTLRATLVPWATELELDRGLPSWAAFDPSTGRHHLDEREPWPIRALSVRGELRGLPRVLTSRAVTNVRHLDLSALRAAPRVAPFTDAAPPRLTELDTLTLPADAFPVEAVEWLAPTFAAVKTVELGAGWTLELAPWLDTLPSLERLRLLPSREPGDGSTAAQALSWADGRGTRLCLEWLGEVHDAVSARRAWIPALPGDRPTLPEERHERLELESPLPFGRVLRERGGARVFLRCDDAPAIDVFSAPNHQALIRPAGLVRVRRALHVELVDPGEPLPLTVHPPAEAFALTRQLAAALRTWWSEGAPDALTGEWVALGRDQLRVRADGSLALVPALTRRMGPDAHALIDLVGVPVAWNRTEPAVVQLAAAAFIEWVTGVSFLDARIGSAASVHRRLALRLAHPPSLRALGEAVDTALHRALTEPRQSTVGGLLEALSRASR